MFQTKGILIILDYLVLVHLTQVEIKNNGKTSWKKSNLVRLILSLIWLTITVTLIMIVSQSLTIRLLWTIKRIIDQTIISLFI
jgi:hypothetical protein